MRNQNRLDEGKIEQLVASLRSIDTPQAELVDAIRIEAGYFEKNAERLRYPEFRRQHLFVGTGGMKAACKTVIGSRLKQSGMVWTVRGANAIIALRCSFLSSASRVMGRYAVHDLHFYVALDPVSPPGRRSQGVH